MGILGLLTEGQHLALHCASASASSRYCRSASIFFDRIDRAFAAYRLFSVTMTTSINIIRANTIITLHPSSLQMQTPYHRQCCDYPHFLHLSLNTTWQQSSTGKKGDKGLPLPSTHPCNNPQSKPTLRGAARAHPSGFSGSSGGRHSGCSGGWGGRHGGLARGFPSATPRKAKDRESSAKTTKKMPRKVKAAQLKELLSAIRITRIQVVPKGDIIFRLSPA